MTPQELKASILQQAIQGKLVEQRPEEGTGEELFQQIQAEKQALIKAGKIKKEKPLPEIADEEIPFDLPSTWKWVRWGNIVNIVSARRVHQADWKANGVPFYRAREIAKLATDGFVHNELFISEELFEEFSKSGVPSPGDLMVTAVGTLGKTYVVKENDRFYYKDASVICFENFAKLCPEFLKCLMSSEMMAAQIKSNSGGTTVSTLTMVRMVEYLMPLPPLAEQKRIVAKLEEILPLIGRYETAWNKLEEFNKRFPGDMQKSILQLAIQGKLVEQRPKEGTGEELFQQIQAEKQALIKAGKIKKEKSLPEIAENEIPFDIPESWKWVRLRSLGVFSSGKTPTMGIVENWDNGTVSWITSKDMKKKYLSSSEMLITEKAASEMKVYPENTVLMVVRSGILKRLLPVAILTGESTINQDVKALSLHMPGISEFVYIILKGMETHILKEYRKQVTTVDSLRFEDFQNMPVPLPPLAEQNRIVAKLEEILPLCERLK